MGSVCQGGGEYPRGAGRAKTKQEKGLGGVLKMKQSILDLLDTRRLSSQGREGSSAARAAGGSAPF